MHENVTHNRDYKTFNEFRREILKFLRQTVPKQWKRFCDRNQRQFPRDPSRRFAGYRLAGVHQGFSLTVGNRGKSRGD